MMKVLGLLGALCLLSTQGNAQIVVGGGANADSVTAEILADTSAVKPGTTFTVGVLYKMQPGWHIYWKFPGASGFATTVQWAGPQGVSLGETLYPAPISFESPGPIISYGYEGETLLMMEARAGEAANGDVTITAKTRWLMCSDRCIPSKKDLTITLPVGEPKPANQAVFAKYRKQVPVKAAQLPGNVKASAKQDGKKTIFELVVTPAPGSTLSAAHKGGTHATYFYPSDEKDYMVEAPTVKGQKSADGTTYQGPVTITYTAEASADGTAPLKKLSGTLAVQGIAGGKPQKPLLLDVDHNL